jgi:transmembrane protein 231
MKYNTYREQPEVRFEYKTIFISKTREYYEDPSSTQPPLAGNSNTTSFSTTKTLFHNKELFVSSIHELNEARSSTTDANSLRMGIIKCREHDENLDGIIDTIHVSVTLPLTKSEEVYGIQALLLFHYRLQNHVKLDLESLVYVNHDAGMPGSSFRSRGNLQLKQDFPIGVRDEFSVVHSNDPLMDIDNDRLFMMVEKSNLEHILNKYESRTISTDYMERFRSWKTDVSSIGQEHIDGRNSESNDEERRFHFEITIEIPKMQEIVYIPGIVETLKEAWIRYVSIFVVVRLLVQSLQRFAFTYQLVKTKMKID